MKKIFISFLIISSLFIFVSISAQTTTNQTSTEPNLQALPASTLTPPSTLQLDKVKAKLKKIRQNVAKIKNKTKRQVAERVYLRMNELNQKLTDHYLNLLDQLEKVLNGISERVDRVASKGIEVSSVKEKITLTQEAINKAKEEVQKQKDKIYEIPAVTTEIKLKAEVGKLRKNLHHDLKSVEALVKETRNKVHDVAVSLAQTIKGEKATSTPTSSPSVE